MQDGCRFHRGDTVTTALEAADEIAFPCADMTEGAVQCREKMSNFSDGLDEGATSQRCRLEAERCRQRRRPRLQRQEPHTSQRAAV
eukprot:scaffold127068_cov57-Phaeocystis_antarctica.AAC.3